ncbi:Cytochrome P450 [Natronoarchaeum philippinense]|uniref:Cytochrome P450 n=1 Tax=Natronoarchaeum philippinense TaxID=558529 RepID=A0A285P0N0_NATPI|nr:cytochrome P450 [Natronoarchaeum philippinense]SNZ15008.1 Cytochrome P450 [Natronoarchaeum philippinense]
MSDAKSVHTPARTPVFGHGIEYARDPISAIEKWGQQDDIVRLEYPGQSFYLVTGPAQIQEILVKKHGQFTIGPAQRASFQGITDHAVNMSTGDDWQRRRRAINPAFTGDTVEAYRERMIAEVTASIDAWDDGEQFDLHKEMRVSTMRMLADTLLGIDVRGDEDVIIAASDSLIDRANFRRLGRYLPDWIPTPTDRRFEKKVRALNDYVGECIEKRRQGESGEDVCSLLLEASDKGVLSEQEVRHNLVGLLLAGTSSPGGSLTHAWRLLDEHPSVRRSLEAEYEAVAGDDGLDPEDIDELVQTRNVITETLRLYPPTVGVNREATEPVTIGGYEFPEGTQFIMPQWVPQRDERFWDDPEAFDPGRWERDADRPQFAYFPFSGGPRFCPGKKVARQEMIIALAEMVGNVTLDVEVDGEIEFTPSMTLRPKTKHRATVRR